MRGMSKELLAFLDLWRKTKAPKELDEGDPAILCRVDAVSNTHMPLSVATSTTHPLISFDSSDVEALVERRLVGWHFGIYEQLDSWKTTAMAIPRLQTEI